MSVKLIHGRFFIFNAEGEEESAVYPGHPAVFALMAMEGYDNVEDALAKEPGASYRNCVSDNRIPGAGDAAHNGARVLTALQEGATPEEAYKLGCFLWERMTGPGTGNYEDRYQEGVEQAAHLRDDFLKKAKEWI